MSIDRSLKSHGSLKGQRSVLTRAERIARLKEEDRFDPETNSPLGLPKVKIHISKAGKKKSAPAEEEAAPAKAKA